MKNPNLSDTLSYTLTLCKMRDIFIPYLCYLKKEVFFSFWAFDLGSFRIRLQGGILMSWWGIVIGVIIFVGAIYLDSKFRNDDIFSYIFATTLLFILLLPITLCILCFFVVPISFEKYLFSLVVICFGAELIIQIVEWIIYKISYKQIAYMTHLKIFSSIYFVSMLFSFFYMSNFINNAV